MEKTDRITTDASVQALKPHATLYAAPDSKVIGLELRVHPDGTKRWSIRYRVRGKQRRLKLGQYPRVSLASAREAATREMRKVDTGEDPKAATEAAKAAQEAAKRDRIEAVIDAYIEQHSSQHNRRWKESASKLLTCRISSDQLLLENGAD